MNNKPDKVLNYLNKFTDCWEADVVVQLFLNTLRARLALDLCQRFHPGELMYAERENHFGARIGERVYDILGDMTDRFKWEPWSSFAAREPEKSAKIYREVVLMEDGV